MPSPRRPRRTFPGRSIMLGAEQEFAIAVAAEDRRGHEAENAPAERRHRIRQILADGGVDPGIADDALLDPGAAGLELWLDEGDEPCGRPRQRQRRRQNELERDEAH